MIFCLSILLAVAAHKMIVENCKALKQLQEE